MIVAIKRRTLIIIALVVAVVIAGIITGIVLGVRHSRANAERETNGVTVVIDAGHGGMDGGVVGRVTGTKESDINLAISRLLASQLEQKGYRVIQTRTTAAGLYGNARHNRKLVDMERRRDLINNANPDLVISIHQNSFPDRSVRGAQVFYAIGAGEDTQNKATIVQAALNDALEDDRQAKSGDFFILATNPFPSLLIECGFLSNAEDEQLLINPTHQARLAQIIASAVDGFLAPAAPPQNS